MKNKKAQEELFNDMNFSINIGDVGDDEEEDEVLLADDLLSDIANREMSLVVSDEDDDPDSDNEEGDYGDEYIDSEYEDGDYNEVNDITFALPLIPGADDDGELEIIEIKDDEISDEEGLSLEVSSDPWDWKGRGICNFIQWLYEMIDSVPRHSGRDTTGIERAISHFENLDREISRAMRVDFKGEIDSAKAEKAREQIQNGLKRLVERLTELKKTKFKKSDRNFTFTKEAKQDRINGITVVVPLLISRLARVLVNGAVSGGHNLERMFTDLSKEYELTKREKAELAQLLEDMGYLYPGQLDRGFLIGEQGDRTSSDNYDLAANYPG